MDNQAPSLSLASHSDRPSTEVPIIFMVFNRPRTTNRVFEAIRAARPRHLMIIADGPRDGRPGDLAGCAAVRSLVKRVDWDCELELNFADTNLGTIRRFASGLEWHLTAWMKRLCLKMTACLTQVSSHIARRSWSGIGMIQESCGSAAQRSVSGAARRWVPFSCRVASIGSWGWATWKRAWRNFDPNLTQLPNFIRARRIEVLTHHSTMQKAFLGMFELAHEGRWANWDIRATFNIWSHDGLVIHPNGNLITNIGFGDDARSTKYQDDPLAELPFRPVGPLVLSKARSMQI